MSPHQVNRSSPGASLTTRSAPLSRFKRSSVEASGRTPKRLDKSLTTAHMPGSCCRTWRNPWEKHSPVEVAATALLPRRADCRSMSRAVSPLPLQTRHR